MAKLIYTGGSPLLQVGVSIYDIKVHHSAEFTKHFGPPGPTGWNMDSQVHNNTVDACGTAACNSTPLHTTRINVKKTNGTQGATQIWVRAYLVVDDGVVAISVADTGWLGVTTSATNGVEVGVSGNIGDYGTNHSGDEFLLRLEVQDNSNTTIFSQDYHMENCT